MSQRRGVLGAPTQQNHHPVCGPTRSKSKRLRTKRERNVAKFGPKVTLGGSRRGLAPPPRWLQPTLWRGLSLGSPLRPPKPVVITHNRLCHRGLFNHEVKSLDVRRLLTPGPGGDAPLPIPQIEEGEAGGIPAKVLKEAVASLASLLASSGAFLGRNLVSERRRSLMAALRQHHHGPPDLGVFLTHRTPAQPPGQGTFRIPEREARPGRSGQAVSLVEWEVRDLTVRSPGPLHDVDRPPLSPCTHSPIFGAPREQETIFSWSSAEEDETPRGLGQNWGGLEGLLPGPAHFWKSPQPRQEEGGDTGWTHITPPTVNLDPSPWGVPPCRHPRGPPPTPTPRPPQTSKEWRLENPRHALDHPRVPQDTLRLSWGSPDPPRTPSRPIWELPDLTQTPPNLPRLPRGPPIWSPEAPRAPLPSPRPIWDPPNPLRPLWKPRPWSPKAAPNPPRTTPTPQLWNPEPPRPLLDAPRLLWSPPRPHRESPDASRPLWHSPDSPRVSLEPLRSPMTPQLWSLEPPWDPSGLPTPPRDPSGPPWNPRPWSPEPPGAPQDPEPSRCCCHRLYRDTAQRDPLRPHLLRHRTVHRDPSCPDALHRAPPHPAPVCRDMSRLAPSHRCQPPKRRRAGRGVFGEGAWGGPGDSPPPPLRPSGCGCPCRGACCGAGFEMRRGL